MTNRSARFFLSSQLTRENCLLDDFVLCFGIGAGNEPQLFLFGSSEIAIAEFTLLCSPRMYHIGYRHRARERNACRRPAGA